jgi:hypothetical protein
MVVRMEALQKRPSQSIFGVTVFPNLRSKSAGSAVKNTVKTSGYVVAPLHTPSDLCP